MRPKTIRQIQLNWGIKKSLNKIIQLFKRKTVKKQSIDNGRVALKRTIAQSTDGTRMTTISQDGKMIVTMQLNSTATYLVKKLSQKPYTLEELVDIVTTAFKLEDRKKAVRDVKALIKKGLGTFFEVV